MFIFELIVRFTDVNVMEWNHVKFYPIHYFYKAFCRNYHLFLRDEEHVIIEFPGIVDSSGSIVDYTQLDTIRKQVFFLFQHWMYFSQCAGGRSFSNYRDLCAVIFQWCLFLHILHTFINLGHDGLDKFRKRDQSLSMMDLDPYEENGLSYFEDNVFDHLDRDELYDEIDGLYRVKRVAINFPRYCKLFLYLFTSY